MKSTSNQNIDLLFVYGSLMQGRKANTRFLASTQDNFLGEAVLTGYRLYDLSFYPAILADDSICDQCPTAPALVFGELFIVDQAALTEIDRYEGEGNLYERRSVEVLCQGQQQLAWTYVYLRPINADLEVATGLQPWRATPGQQVNDRFVWYAAYGSNCLKERFLTYIEGGCFREMPKVYAGCRDRSLPLTDFPYTIDYEMYFGNQSANWQGGVCFLDLNKPGTTLGRIYLITREQLFDVQKQEGQGTDWYHIIQILGDFGGISVMTLTNSRRLPANVPSKSYMQVVREGIGESYSIAMSENKIDDYLADCGCIGRD
jgi:gamma-glutamylcyclotransferase (GGCT)/AIG2-like uncharacterized protein YtfP